MRTKSPISRLVQRLALFSVFLAACYADNADAQYRPFVNISTRAEVLNGQNVIIAGFIIQTTATTTKPVLIRGMGPSFGLSLADPKLTLNGPNGVITNNNWGDTQYSQIAATGMQPGNGNESAILVTLPAGSYTVTLEGNNGGTGVGLVEVYDMAWTAPPIVNLSSRARVGTGDNVLIGGVYVCDSTRAVVRAIGPTLANHGVSNPLGDPMLELYNAQGTQLASNDNYGTTSGLAEIQYLGLQPGSVYESAILTSLAPGSYTVIVKGVNNGTGVGMVELYGLADAKYPRIFQAWADADYNNEDRLDTVARHDLLWTTQNGFGYSWVDSNGNSTADYHSETISYNGTEIPYPIQTLRDKNPNIKILVQVVLVTLGPESLPDNDVWWKRDGSGNRVPGPGGSYLLDLDNTSLQAHIANQAAALMQTGKFDGVMFDSVDSNTTWLLPVLTAVRTAIGENGLIIVNANSEQLSTQELNQINGVFMETGRPETGGGHPTWQAVKAALDHNELHTRDYKVNCLETWFVTSRTNSSDLKRMRATTALSLTHSKNGYALFGDSGHFHQFYNPFWTNHNLGVPLGTYTTMSGGYADRREFQNGTVIWNAAASTTLNGVTFPQKRKSLATGTEKLAGQSFSVPPSDGDIFVIVP
jgi:hypothetical protein